MTEPLKLVVTSDWHVDAVTCGVPRFQEIRAAVEDVVRVALQERVHAVMFLGDLCDPDSGSSVFRGVELALETAHRLSKEDIASVWMAGNHDVIEDGSGDTTLSPLRAIATKTSGNEIYPGDVFVVEVPRTFHMVGREEVFAFLPFVASSHDYSPAGIVEDQIVWAQGREMFIFGHLNISGIFPGEETTEMARGRNVTFPIDTIRDLRKEQRTHLFNGHYHRQQVFEGIHIPGSLARLTFGEQDHDPSFLYVEVEGGA